MSILSGKKVYLVVNFNQSIPLYFHCKSNNINNVLNSYERQNMKQTFLEAYFLDNPNTCLNLVSSSSKLVVTRLT